MFNQELGDTFNFLEKTLSNYEASLFAVKIQCVSDIMLRSRMERIYHRRSLARSRAMASCPETAKIEPDSNSASLRSASRSQASSTSGSESRLEINRSSRCDRSTGANRRTSASRTSRFVLTLTSNAVDADSPQLITASGGHNCARSAMPNEPVEKSRLQINSSRNNRACPTNGSGCGSPH